MSYQAIYDAAFQQFDISYLIQQASNAITNVELEHVRPSVLFRPKVSLDGNQWCALYGDNLQEGVAGFGRSPSEACYAFDLEWTKEPAPKPKG